jgi:hypothetical protein
LRSHRSLVRLALGSVLVAAVLFSVSMADAQAPVNPKQPKVGAPMGDPPATQAILTNLRAWFKKYANENDEWDKECVARAFGYRHAYDWVPETSSASKKTDKDDDAKKEEAKKEKDDKEDSMINKPAGPKLDSRYSKRRDFRFLAALDKDGDEKISREEFEEWALDYARELGTQADTAAKANQLAQMLARLQQMQNSMQNRQPNQRYTGQPNNNQQRPGQQVANNNNQPKPQAKPAPKPQAKPAPKPAPKQTPKKKG